MHQEFFEVRAYAKIYISPYVKHYVNMNSA